MKQIVVPIKIMLSIPNLHLLLVLSSQASTTQCPGCGDAIDVVSCIWSTGCPVMLSRLP